MVNENTKKIYLFDFLVLSISTTSVAIVLLLYIDNFHLYQAVLLGFLLSFALVRCPHIRIQLSDARFNFLLLLILLVALLLRLPANLYTMGGQDQGTYINMSALFARQGKLLLRDVFRDTLTNNEQNLYDLQGKYVLPGFQQQGPDESVYLMKFYPLFPAWMSLLSTYALTIFSLLSITGFYLLVHEITKNKSLANLAAFLIAIQPTHVFFSKFPLTEIPTLAFTSLGFYYLIRSLNQLEENRTNFSQIMDLILSLVLFNAFFYTRMSSFIYLPFFLAALFIITLHRTKNFWLYFGYTVSWILLTIVSFFFYFKKQYALYDEIVGRYLEKIVNPENAIVLILFTLSYLAILFALHYVKKSSVLERVRYLLSALLTFAYTLASVFILLGVPYQVSKILEVSLIANRWYFVSNQLSTLKHLTFYQTINHIGPFLFLLVILGSLFIYKNREKFTANRKLVLQLITIFPAYFLLVTSLFASIFDYNYYRSRYLVSEVIPYTILLAVVIYHYTRENRTLNKIFKVLIGCTIIYYAFFSFIQMGTSEGPDVSFYNNLIKTVGKDSLLLVDKSYRSGSAVTAPLVWYYNLRAFIVDEEILKSPVLANLIDKNEKVYLLAPYPTSSLTANTGEKMRLRYNYLGSNPDCSEHSYSYLPIESQTYYLPKNKLSCFLLPSAYFTGYIDLYLFKIK